MNQMSVGDFFDCFCTTYNVWLGNCNGSAFFCN